ncbi:hypothetical protein C8R45DRAFT_1114324 [Mycena sanguinolenta]|nr:hypothetical protein C8R45DRAFT_1114324 [Mycena sanguinolenta]
MSFYFSHLFFSVDDGIDDPVLSSSLPIVPSRTPPAASLEIFPVQRKPSARVIEGEEILMQTLADEEKDVRPDDGAIEIDSDEGSQAWMGEKSAKVLEAPLAKALPLTKALEILRPPPKALWAVTGPARPRRAAIPLLPSLTTPARVYGLTGACRPRLADATPSSSLSYFLMYPTAIALSLPPRSKGYRAVIAAPGAGCREPEIFSLGTTYFGAGTAPGVIIWYPEIEYGVETQFNPHPSNYVLILWNPSRYKMRATSFAAYIMAATGLPVNVVRSGLVFERGAPGWKRVDMAVPV